MNYGYARVSTEKQSLDLQLDALSGAGCEEIFSEKVSGTKKDRPALDKLLLKISEGDTIYCYKLDRLGRSLKDLVELMGVFEEKGVRFVSLADGIDTAKSGSKLLLNILMCIADFEAEIIRNRTIAGLEAAKKRGVKLGRPVGLSEKGQVLARKAVQMVEGGASMKQITNELGVSKPTAYKYVKWN